jgi:hypothetical protein
LRRIEPGTLRDAAEAFDAAIQEVRALRGEPARRLERHILAGRVAPFLAAGRAEDARTSARAAFDLADGSPIEVVESTLRIVQAEAAAGHSERARAYFESIGPVDGLPRWLRGWVRRYEPAFAGADFDATLWNAAQQAAWRENDGYGFQRRLILARIAAEPARFDPDAWPARALRELSDLIARLHRAQHFCPTSRCTVCSSRPLAIRAAHALGMKPGLLDPMFST